MEFEILPSLVSGSSSKEVIEVPVLTTQISYDEFFRNYMEPNVPCVIQDVTANWASAKLWVVANGQPNISYLKNKYGSSTVTVYHCNEKYYNSQKTTEMTLDNYFEKWLDPCLYLKDWHMANTFKNDHFYEVPIYFASDWLNEYLIATDKDDYRFVYMGKAGTWTPFHSDVFGSYSWSANVCGRKRWVLFPPGVEDSFRDSLGNLPYSIESTYKNYRHFELIQETGQAIFVPSGWYHQVWNLDDTISINHNWINGCNIDEMWMGLVQALDSVKKEIDDCRDMEGFSEHCQVMLKATHGMDLRSFYKFIQFIAEKRLSDKNDMFHGHCLGKNHKEYDLCAVKCVLAKMMHHEDFQNKDSANEILKKLS